MFQNEVNMDENKKEGKEIQGDVGSFSILKEEKVEKLSGEMKLSVKNSMSSKLAEGILSENLEMMNSDESVIR